MTDNRPTNDELRKIRALFTDGEGFAYGAAGMKLLAELDHQSAVCHKYGELVRLMLDEIAWNESMGEREYIRRGRERRDELIRELEVGE